jgi:hypothetical protein
LLLSSLLLAVARRSSSLRMACSVHALAHRARRAAVPNDQVPHDAHGG